MIEALEQMHEFAKFMINMVTKKGSTSFENDDKFQHCSVIAIRSLLHKNEDHVALIIPCTIGLLKFSMTLCHLSYSINLIPLSI